MKHIRLNKQYILFDLDGTITDSAEGIINSFQYALDKFDIHVHNRDELKPVVGPPLKQSFMEFFNMSETIAEKAVEEYRVYFKEKGMLQNKLYPNVISMLHLLKDMNKTIILATSKPTVFSEQILKHFSIDKFFTHIIGSNLDGSRTDKCEIISAALKEAHVKDLSKAIMIGDRKFDIEGAKACGIDSIAVTYGYGSMDELKNCNATHFASDVLHLLSHFIGNSDDI